MAKLSTRTDKNTEASAEAASSAGPGPAGAGSAPAAGSPAAGAAGTNTTGADPAPANAPVGDRPAASAGADGGAASPAPAEAPAVTPGLRIAAKRDGFRRAGMAHSKTPTDYPAGFFTADQLAALKAEPMLTVEEL